MKKEMKGCGKLDDMVAFMQTILEPSAYVGMGKGTELVTAPFKMEEGVQQGAVESAGSSHLVPVQPSNAVIDC